MHLVYCHGGKFGLSLKIIIGIKFKVAEHIITSNRNFAWTLNMKASTFLRVLLKAIANAWFLCEIQLLPSWSTWWGYINSSIRGDETSSWIKTSENMHIYPEYFDYDFILSVANTKIACNLSSISSNVGHDYDFQSKCNGDVMNKVVHDKENRNRNTRDCVGMSIDRHWILHLEDKVSKNNNIFTICAPFEICNIIARKPNEHFSCCVWITENLACPMSICSSHTYRHPPQN